MKIGLLTFHRAHNYGAVLQCFALKRTLEKSGHNVSVINHKCVAIDSAYPNGRLILKNKSLKQKCKSIVKYIISGYRTKRRFEIFQNFISEYILKPKSIERLTDINNQDVIIFGSDQIWNDNITKGENIYWGKGIPSVKKIGYAVSAGKFEQEIYKHRDDIFNFDSIGVREKSLEDEINKLGYNKTETVLDPTLLFDKESWIKALKLKSSNNGKYILVYTIRNREKVLNIAEDLSRKFNLPILEIAHKVEILNKPRQKELLSPINFLEYILNAEIVITSSFHGTVFSILFEKPFLSVKLDDGQDGRVASLLDSLGLSKHHVSTKKEIRIEDLYKINYSAVISKIEKLRRKSLDFLLEKIHS